MKILHLKKRYKIILGIVLFLVILLFAAPRIGRWYIVKNSHKLIGRNLAINKIRINYFTGTLRIHDLELFEADSKTVFASFKRLKVNIRYLPLLKNELFVRNITLDNPYVQVLQNGNKFNFTDLITSDTSTSLKDTIPHQPMKYIINNIRINTGNMEYTDVPLSNTIALDNLNLVIPGFTWNSDSTNLDMNFRFVDGGGLYSRLDLNQTDSTYSIKLKIDSLNLDIITPYIHNYMHISALNGFLSNDVIIKGNMRSVMQLSVKGVNHINGFQLLDTMNRKILSFNDLTIDIDTLQIDKNKIYLKYVGMTDPFILFERIDSTNNWLALMKPQAGEQPDSRKKQKDTTVKADKGSYRFSKLQISGGSIQFSDKTISYPFDYTFDNIKIESAPVPGISGKLSIKMSAGLNNTGNLAVDVILNPADLTDIDLSLSIGQFRMKDVDAYFKNYFGFPVTGGIMNFKTDDKIRTASLFSNNSLYFRKFTLAESMHTKVDYHVPLRLALAILSDKDGIIDLKAPVESKGKEIKVMHLGKIIFKVIGNLFVKAAISPFRALAGPYNVDPSTLQEIKLGLMEASPDDKNMKSVDIISDILDKKPGLSADFYYCLDRTKAADTLAYILALEDFINYLKTNGGNVRNVADSTLIKYLLTMPTSATIREKPELRALCRNYIGTEMLNAWLDSIKTFQIGFMTNYLSRDKNLNSDRFKIIPTVVDTIKPSGNYPAFRIYFAAGEEKE